MEKRTSVKQLYTESQAFGGQVVTVKGWARTIRDSKAFGFIELNDGSFFKNLQIVFERAKLNNYDEIIRLHYESLCLLNRFKTSEKDNK